MSGPRKPRISPDTGMAQERLLLSEVLKLVGRSLAPEVVIREMLHLLSELLGLNRGRLVLLDEEDSSGPNASGLTPAQGAAQGAVAPRRPQRARIRHAYGLTRREMARGRYQVGEGVTGLVLQTGQAVLVQDIDQEPRFLFRSVAREDLPPQTVAFLAFPVEIDRRTVGVLACHRIRRRHRALSDDVAILKLLATLTGQVLQLARLVRQETEALQQQNELLRGALASSSVREGIVGQSAALLRSLHDLERVADSSATVLLLGESGTGKELFARAVHRASPRRDGPFIKINCAAIPETLFESELFGHEKGAFTGATAVRAGWFERAHAGTLFLDEIGELPLAMQSKLLRALQERTIVRLGGRQDIAVDVRLVAATHRPLLQEVAAGRFRQDLYYRLNVVPIRLPSLRERREDIRPLVMHFLNRANQDHQRNVHFEAAALDWLEKQAWPGNIRELGNLIERVVLLSTSPRVSLASLQAWAELAREDGDAPGLVAPLALSIAAAPSSPLSAPLSAPSPAPRSAPREAPLPSSSLAPRDYRSIESPAFEVLQAALHEHAGNQSRAARALGLTPRQFAYRWRRHNQTLSDN
jgi:Nif-specific regulatory protein